MTKRLSDKQKSEIVQSFECGESIDDLSQKFKCTKETVKRNLKKNLGELKYNELINKNKSSKEKAKAYRNINNNLLNINLNYKDPKEVTENIQTLEENKDDSNFSPIESFFEIAPVDCEIDKSSRKELSSVPISDLDLPKIVYMIVDKKIELEIKLLKDFPDWEFLPEDDLKRKTIEIFFDLNIAKKSCTKEQKVLKVPNTDVFRIAAPFLLSRGISRIVFAEHLIAL